MGYKIFCSRTISELASYSGNVLCTADWKLIVHEQLFMETMMKFISPIPTGAKAEIFLIPPQAPLIPSLVGFSKHQATL